MLRSNKSPLSSSQTPNSTCNCLCPGPFALYCNLLTQLLLPSLLRSVRQEQFINLWKAPFETVVMSRKTGPGTIPLEVNGDCPKQLFCWRFCYWVSGENVFPVFLCGFDKHTSIFTWNCSSFYLLLFSRLNLVSSAITFQRLKWLIISLHLVCKSLFMESNKEYLTKQDTALEYHKDMRKITDI